MGIAKVLAEWKPLCRKGGYLVVSDMTLFQMDPPVKLLDFLKACNVTLRNGRGKTRRDQGYRAPAPLHVQAQ
ncbi:MAG TPA: hypothetical protein HA264_10140 [Methanolinea sp.]|nr:hypothetical protein [Methanolinea sp.]